MIFNPLVPSLKKHLQCNNIEDEGHKFKLYGLFWSQIYNQFPSFLEHWWELKYASLFHDALAEDYESIAPYLVELPPDHEDLDDILRHYGEGGCIFLCSSLDFEELLYRMRELFNIEDDEGNAARFHFFDPIVLRNITEDANPEIMQQLFTQVMCYYCEAENDPKTLYRYSYDGSDVAMKIFSLEEEEKFKKGLL